MPTIMEDRGHLTTELRNPESIHLDRMATDEAFDLLNRQDAEIARAIALAKADICRAIDLVVEAFQSGGRLIYVGAGTSGRLGVLDAAECPPTFLTDPDLVQGIIAGGEGALTRSIEGAEDLPRNGVDAVDQRRVTPHDVVLGITTGGTTPFVHGALERARQIGAKTVFFACVPGDQVADQADVSIRIETGPEVLTGSTRLKAGTATKMVLNMVTTLAMVRMGKVYENLMVDVNTSASAKLVDRGVRMIQEVTGASRRDSSLMLKAAGGKVKTGIVMYFRQLDRETAERLLLDAQGQVRDALNLLPSNPAERFE